MDLTEAIKELDGMSRFTLGSIPLTKQAMLSRIEELLSRFPSSFSFKFELALGSALYQFVFNHVRGEERKPYLKRVVTHFEKARSLSLGKTWQALTYIQEAPHSYIAATLGIVLVREALIRDLDKAIGCLEPIFSSTTQYHPALCFYAEALYKRGQYVEAARIAEDLHRRAERDPEWKGIIPPAPLSIAASAYRAEAKRQKKEGHLSEAKTYFEKLLNTGQASENDRHLLDLLNSKLQAAKAN